MITKPIDFEILLPSLGIVPHSAAPIMRCTTNFEPMDCSGVLFRTLTEAGWKGKAFLSHQRVIDRVHPFATVIMRDPMNKIKHTFHIMGMKGDKNLHLYSHV